MQIRHVHISPYESMLELSSVCAYEYYRIDNFSIRFSIAHHYGGAALAQV